MTAQYIMHVVLQMTSCSHIIGHMQIASHDSYRVQLLRHNEIIIFIGPIPWGHSGPLCHALSLSSLSWTSMRRWHATVPLATSGELA